MDEVTRVVGRQKQRVPIPGPPRKRSRVKGLATVGAGITILVTGMLGGIILALIRAAIGGILLTFAANLVHSQVEAVPALSYLPSFGLLLGLSVLSSAARGGTTK